MREIPAIVFELRGMSTTGHLLRSLPLALLTPALSLWPYIGSPFAPAIIATLITLEPFYNNTLNMWQGQMTSAALHPQTWTAALRRRNLAVLIATWAMAAFFGTLVSFVQTEPPAPDDILALAFCLASMQFPLLMIGNSFSWQQIRNGSGWGLEDAAAALIMLIGGGLTSLPYLIIAGAPGHRIMLTLYTASAGILWWTWSVPRTARDIQERYTDLWHRIHL